MEKYSEFFIKWCEDKGYDLSQTYNWSIWTVEFKKTNIYCNLLE